MEIPDNIVTAFASLDHARLSRMSEQGRARQLDARQHVLEYIDALWQDVQRAGEHPDIGEKYQALTVVRELARSLTSVAFDAVYDLPPT